MSKNLKKKKLKKKLIINNKKQINNSIILDTNKYMKTFKQLYKFLQSYNQENIYTWLEDPWKGKDKQESLLRLFAGLGLISKLNKYDVCKGNFNLNTITKMTSIKDIFYYNEKSIKLKDKGDSSDLTCISKNNNYHLLLTTSKNLNKTQVGKLDIDKILTNYQDYKENGYTMSLCICIRNYDDFCNMITNIEKTNKKLKLFLDKEDTIVIDWIDLNQAFQEFKTSFQNKPLKKIIGSNKNTLCLKMHQKLSVIKTLKMKNYGENKILWGHIQRSGKSYIIAGCIIKDSYNKEKCNYIVITTAPNETIDQQKDVFNCIQLDNFNIILLNGKNKKPKLKNKNIIICSKQFLQAKISDTKEKTKSIPWLKEMNFEIRFIDESHNGGTTKLARKTLDFYGKNNFTIQITATYSKPINDYNIPKKNWILWDLEDIKLCKNIMTNNEYVERLKKKHGKDIIDILDKYSLNNIINEYSKYPELWLLTNEIKPDNLSEIIKCTKDNDYGWSLDSCFLLKQCIKKDKTNKIIFKEEFQNENENIKLWYSIFGKKSKFKSSDNDYPDKNVFIKRIEKICKNPLIDSRFIGEGDFYKEPMIIMAFLPQNNINMISNATIKLLKKYNIIPEYEVISINTKTTKNPKKSIEDARIRARNNKKKCVLVLSGRQCSLGVSIDNCDIVLLLNNNLSFDMIYQMMFRSMTEGKNKKCGFVIDLNIHRVIDKSIINYASLIKPNLHPKIACKYILQEKLINLNGDHWMPSFGNDITKLDNLCNNIYKIYSSDTEKALNHFLNRLKYKQLLLSNDEQILFNTVFSNKVPNKEQKSIIEKLLNDNKIKKGIEIKVVKEEDNSKETKDDKKDIVDVKYMEILKHIIPLVCLLTIHHNETSFVGMFNIIKKDKYTFDILIDQTKSWWGKSIESSIIKKFVDIFIKYINDDKETNQIIRVIKELFTKNIKNSKELSNLIDKYLIPLQLEKKRNAEVSTKYELRQEMLEKIPKKFWESENKIFEPCVGKGGFILDIIDKFMIGLKNKIPDKKTRYKNILEKCLYLCDINPTNIFICKLLIDPYNEYKLNYHQGNTLDLDVKKKWNIDGFNAIVGNPPYENVNKKGDNHLYIDFSVYSINNLVNDGLLLFITPKLILENLLRCDINRKRFKEFYNINYLVIDTPKKYFPNIGTNFVYFLLEKKPYEGTCKIEYLNNQKIEYSNVVLKEGMYLPNNFNKIGLKIISKTTNKLGKNNNKLFNEYVKRPMYTINNKVRLQRIRKEHFKKNIISKEKKDKFKFKISNGFTRKKYKYPGEIYYFDNKMIDFKKKKIVISNIGFELGFDKKGDLNLSDSLSYILGNEVLFSNFKNLLSSNLIKFLLLMYKNNTLHDTYKLITKNLLHIPLDIKMTNSNIYKHFNISNEEIEYIEKKF